MMVAIDGEQIVFLTGDVDPGLVVLTDTDTVLVDAGTASEVVLVTSPDGAPTLSIEDSQFDLVVAGEQGPRGERGLTGDSTTPQETYEAGASITAYRAVCVNAADGYAYHASFDNVLEAGSVIGLATNSVTPTNDVDIHTFGGIDNPGWSWSPQLPVFLGSDGQLTQTAASTDSITEIGVAISATRLFVSIQDPVYIQ